MSFVYRPLCKRAIQAATGLALCFLMVSCTESKASQCNRLIEVANQVVSEVRTVSQDVSQNTAPGNVQAIGKIASAADDAKQKMQSLNLGDEQLKQFQTRYIQMYTEISQSSNELVKAANAKNPEDARTAFDSFKKAIGQEAPLVEEVNTYCGS
jgi:hypothetical protein